MMKFDANKFSKMDEKYMTPGEREEITALRKRVLAGELPVETANARAEEIRSKYGYIGGTDGSGYTPTTFNFEHQGELEDARKRLQGFSMEDYRKGGEYKKLLDQYTAAGKDAMKDTLGEVAARTGGMASSYAVAAGQDQYNRYMQGLEDAAQQDYDRKREELRDDVTALENRENQSYNRYLKEIETNRDELDRETAAQLRRDGNEKTLQKEYIARVESHLANHGELKDLPESVLKGTGLTEAELRQMEYTAGLPTEPLEEPKKVYDPAVLAVAAELKWDPEQVQALKDSGATKWTQTLETLGINMNKGRFTSAVAKKWQEQYDRGLMKAEAIAEEIDAALRAKPPQISEEEADAMLAYMGY